MRIAVAAPSALRNEHAFLWLNEIVKHLVSLVVVDRGTDGNRDFNILAITSVPVAAFPMAAAFGAKCVVVTKLQKCIFVDVAEQVNVAAITTVAATGPTARNKLLPAKCDAAVPAVSGFDCD